MKKLKIALSLIFALTFSLFLVACGGGGEVMDIVINTENAKTEFKEGEAFDATGLVVNVYYRGKDDPVTLEEGKYNIDSSKFDSSKPGTYEIVVDPEQTPAENAQRVTKSYTVTVVHNWTFDENGNATCPCGAKQTTLNDLTDTVTTVAWGSQATLTEQSANSPAVAPIAGENHVNYGVLVPGQTTQLTLKILEVDTGSTWNTPLMGVRNGVDGLIPREDSYVIGTCAGFSTPEGGTKDAAPQSGTATKDSTPWLVYKSGDVINAADLVGGTVVVSYEYSSDSVMTIRHTLTMANGSTKTQTNSFAVPRASYEIVAYGEKVTYQVTKINEIMNNEVLGFTAELPDNVYQPEGKLFDTTGLTTSAAMSDNTTIDNSYNAYAMLDVVNEDGTTTPTRMNLATTPLSAEMYDFYVEFAGVPFYFTSTGKPGGESQITVVPSEFSVANASAVVKNGVVFDAPLFTADYAVNATHDAVEITAGGTAAVLTAAQKEELGTTADYFVAVKLSGFAEGAVDGAAVDNNGYVHYADGVVELILPVSDGVDYTLTLTKEGATVQTTKINLEKVVVPEVGVYVASTDFTLDAGGTYNVVFTGAAGTDDEQLVVGGMRSTIGEIKAAINENPEEGWAALSGQLWVTSVEKTDEGVVVGVKVAAPDLINLSSTNASSAVEYRDADNNTLASAALNYEMRFSETIPEDVKDIVKISGDTVVFVQRDKLYVIRAVSADSVAGKLEYSDLYIDATLNIQNETGISYDVSVSTSESGVKADASNAITLSSDASGKLVALGNVGSATDYDYGALVVYSFSVKALGFREDDVKETYYFTANEDTVNGQETYTIYTVSGNEIAATTVEATGERTSTQTRTCVKDGIVAYTTENGFKYGAIITPATGEHQFSEYDENNQATCSECGAVKTKYELGENSYTEITLLSVDDAEAVANTDTDGADWWVGTMGQQTLSGNFQIRYTWTNTRDAAYLSDGALMLEYAGSDESIAEGLHKRFLENATDASNTTQITAVTNHLWGEDSVITAKVYKNGEETTYPANAFDQGKTTWEGDYEVIATRIGTTLTIEEKVVLTSGDTWTGILTITNFSTENLLAQIGGNAFHLDDITVTVGEVSTPVTESFDNPVVWNTWYDVPVSLGQGRTLTVWGTQTSKMEQVYHTVLWEFKEGFTGRLDAFGWNFNPKVDEVENPSAFSATYAVTSRTVDGEDWTAEMEATYKEIAASCNYTLTFEWASAETIAVTVELENGEHTYVCGYAVTVVDEEATAFNLHLTAEAVENFTVAGYSVK